MASLKKILVGTTIGAGVVGLALYLKGLKRTSDELETQVNSKVLSFDLKKGITLQANVLLKNPSNRSLKIKFPTVKVLHKNKVIATSKVENKDFVIPKFEEKALDPITITVPSTALLSAAGSLLQLITKQVSIPLAVKVISNVDLGWTKKDYIKTQDLTIKPKKA